MTKMKLVEYTPCQWERSAREHHWIMTDYLAYQRPDVQVKNHYDFYSQFDKIVLTFDLSNGVVQGIAFVKNRKGVIEQWAETRSIAKRIMRIYTNEST